MQSDARKITIIVLAGMWINVSEFFRNQVLLNRHWDEALHSSLKHAAQQHGVSINRYIRHILKQAVGLSKDQHLGIWHDLDHLAGTWTLEQARELGLCLNEQRDFDERMD